MRNSDSPGLPVGPAHLGSPVVLFPRGRPVWTEAEGGEARAQTRHRGGVLEAWAGADLSEQDTPSSQTPASHRAQTGALAPVSPTGHFTVRPRAQTPPHPAHPLAGGTVRSRVSLGKGEQTTSVSLGGALLQAGSWEQEMERGCSPRHRLLPSLLGDQASPARPAGDKCGTVCL